MNSTYESSWGYGWEAGGDDFEGFTSREPELNVIEFLESLDDVERITSTSTSTSTSPAEKLSSSSSLRDSSPEQYAFNAAAYELTIRCLETGTKPTEKQLKKADPLFPEKKRGNRAIPEGAVSKWKSFSSNLQVVEVEIEGMRRKGLNSKWEKSNRIIACREDWPFIVERLHSHAQTGACLSLRETLHAVGQLYITGNRKHGIPEEFIRARVSECIKCDEEASSKRARKTHTQILPERWPEEHSIPWQNLDEFIESLCIRHRVSLRKESTYRIASPEPSIVTTWVCSRGYRKQESGPSSSASPPCSYRVRTIIPVRISGFPELNPGSFSVAERPEVMEPEPVQLSDFHELGGHESFFDQEREFLESNSCLVTVLLNRAHRGHNPSEKEDYINFSVHPAAKEAVFYEFDVSSDTISVARASLRMDMLLKSRASDIEKATSRFHLLPREVAQLTIELNSQGKLASSDWARLLKEVEAHRKKSSSPIVFFQQYDVFNPAEEKQPFVCVIMTPWMREIAERFSGGNVWALDSTFKTCVRGLPLYAAAVPNQDGIGMPVFFMICSADTGSRHESVALRLAFAAVFKQLSVRPAAIIMDKSRPVYDALSDVVSRDDSCWKDGKLVACRLLLCWFCVKKAWVEDLLPQVAPENRRDVYRRLDAMMLSATETEFNTQWINFKEHYGAIKEMIDYLELGWLGPHSPWRSTWPAFGRLFEHGSHETIKTVTHFWLLLKYSIFQGRLNYSNSDLLVALIGSAFTNTPTLEAFYRQRQSLCDSRRYQSQASTSAERKRLLAAECFLASYNNGNKRCFEVMSEPGFLFRLQCAGGGQRVVNLLTNFCDCLETRFTCEHLLAARLVLKHHFVAMYGLLERRGKEGDEPVTQVEDLDLAWLEERQGQDEERAMGIGSVESSASAAAGSANSDWDVLVQEVAHVQMQLSNLQACCEDQLLVSPAVEELSSILASQLKSLRAFTGGPSSELHPLGVAGSNAGGGGGGKSGVGIIQEHLKACKLQAVKCSVEVKGSNSSKQQGSYAHAQTVVHPKLGLVHYYKQLKPARVSRRKCAFCGVYNVVGGAFEVTECKNCCRYLFYEILPRHH